MKKKHGIPQQLPLILLICILVFTIGITGGVTLARWASEIHGAASAEVAFFEISASAITSGNLAIDCSENTAAAYRFQVSNQTDHSISQVAVSYSIQVELTESLPAGLTMVVDGISGTASGDGLTYTFINNAWNLPAGSGSACTHTLVFTADPDALTSDSSSLGITVHVIAEQIN